MRRGSRAAFAAGVLVLQAATAVHAQRGRADLRYVAPLPAAVTFTTVDSIRSTTGGLPTGDMTATGTTRTVDELRFATGGDGVVVTAILKEISGEMASPMSAVPISVDERPPVEFTIGPKGPGPIDRSGAAFQLPGTGADLADALTSRMALARLVGLPGRALSVGESWVDTVRLSPEDPQPLAGFELEMLVAIRGTYAGDTVAGGRTLNVLRIVTEMTAKGSGTVQGMEVTQDMTTTTEATVLWDSELHVPLRSDAVAQSVVESTVPGVGVTVRMDVRSRSSTTAEVAR